MYTKGNQNEMNHTMQITKLLYEKRIIKSITHSSDPNEAPKAKKLKRGKVNQPGRAGMAQEATGLGDFSTSTRHIRQLPAMERRLW